MQNFLNGLLFYHRDEWFPLYSIIAYSLLLIYSLYTSIVLKADY